MSTGRILVLLEDGACREESVRYAFELAKRLHACVEVLILFSSRVPVDGTGDALGKSIEQVAAEEGICITTFVRRGDKASELVKHMATHPPVDMMVWGGDESALSAGRAQRSKHWLARVRKEIECPVLTATKKTATT